MLGKRLTQDEAALKDSKCGIQRVGKYISYKIKTEYVCSICNKLWVVAPEEVWRGRKAHSECMRTQNNHKKLKYQSIGDMHGTYWNILLNNAKSRKINVVLTMQEAYDLFLKQNKKCFYTNLDIHLPKTSGGNYTASLDRIDSSKDYTIDNVVWCHKDINRMKTDFSKEDFINYCHLISKKNNKFTYSY